MRKLLLATLIITLWGCSNKENNGTETATVQSNAIFRSGNTEIDFKNLTPKDIRDAADIAIMKAEEYFTEVIGEKDHVNFQNTVMAYDLGLRMIDNVFAPMELLYETHPDEAIRNAAKSADSLLKSFIYDIEFRNEIYLTLKAYTKTDEAKQLNEVQKRFLDEKLLKYKQGGMELSKGKQRLVKKYKAKIDRLTIKFRGNIAATKGIVEITKADTAGIDPGFLEARKNDKGTYYLDMSYPTSSGIMGYAKSEKVRKRYQLAFKNRGMPDNLETLDSVLYYRMQLANMLGYKTYADYKLDTRMAKTTNAVWQFEDELKKAIQPKADYDYKKLIAAKFQMTGEKVKKLNAWELSILTNKIKKEEYAIDERKLSEYFEMNAVIQGLFEITQKLFGLKYTEIENPNTWHEDVRMFNCYDSDSDKLLGRFYLDFFPRDNKYSHAACFPIRSGFNEEIAEAALVCNFPKPEGDKPSLMEHDDVETFFHEFGHLIHSLVARSEMPGLSGINGVMLDFVEAPSQIYENWAYQKEILAMFAKHYKTGEPMPMELIDKKIEAKNLNSGLSALRQIFYASFDMHLHHKYKPYDAETTSDIKDELMGITMFEPLGGGNFQASFGHLMGYGAGYYGYMWSKVYAQDMWSRFMEEGIMNKELGMEYRRKILEPGSSKDAFEMVRDFLGRDPNNEAMLNDMGLNDIN